MHKNLLNYVRNHYNGQKVIFAYEAGPTGFGLYDKLNEKKFKCLVLAPANIPTALGQKVKTNRLDSLKISSNLRGGQLESIHIPSQFQCAWISIRKDPELKAFYQRIYNRHNKKVAACIAIVAVAHKLTTRIFAVLTEQRNYEIRYGKDIKGIFSLKKEETKLLQGKTREIPEAVTTIEGSSL